MFQVACPIQQDIVMHPFAFRAHAHGLGNSAQLLLSIVKKCRRRLSSNSKDWSMWVTASVDKPMSKNGLRSVESHLNCRRRSIRLRTTFPSDRMIMWPLFAPCSTRDHIWLKLGKSRHERSLRERPAMLGVVERATMKCATSTSCIGSMVIDCSTTAFAQVRDLQDTILEWIGFVLLLWIDVFLGKVILVSECEQNSCRCISHSIVEHQFVVEFIEGE